MPGKTMKAIICINYHKRVGRRHLLTSIDHAYQITFVSPDAMSVIDDDTVLVLFNYERQNALLLQQIRDIKQHHAQIPIIMTTCRYDSTAALWALRSKICDYIVLEDESGYLRGKIDVLININPLSGQRARDVYFPAKQPDEGIRSEVENKTDPAIKFIDENYSNPIRISNIATLCAMSEKTMSRRFRKEQGMTVSEYIKKSRMHAAKTMLVTTDLPVSVIARKTGFENVSLFNRLFKEDQGVVPTTYRSHPPLNGIMVEKC